MDNTKSYTDANGTTYIIDKKTRKIQSSMCRSGFIYDAEGKRTGHIDGDNYIKGQYH